MKCRICSEEIILVPSAAARAASPSNRQGWSAADYTRQFTTHSHCALAECDEQTRQLMERHRNEPLFHRL